MTYPSYPGYPYPAPVPRRDVSVADAVTATVLLVVATVLGLLAAYFTIFFAFAADSCGANDCRDGYLGAAFAVSWGGTAFALGGAVVMLVVSAVRRKLMWIWPAAAIVVIIASFLVGFALAAQVAS